MQMSGGQLEEHTSKQYQNETYTNAFISNRSNSLSPRAPQFIANCDTSGYTHQKYIGNVCGLLSFGYNHQITFHILLETVAFWWSTYTGF